MVEVQAKNESLFDEIKLKKSALELQIKAGKYISKKEILENIKTFQDDFKEIAIGISRQSGYPLDFIVILADDIIKGIKEINGL